MRSAFFLFSLLTGVAFAADPSWQIFVTDEASGDLAVIDGRTNSVVARIPLGKRPRGIQASPDGTTLFVALSGSPSAGAGQSDARAAPADKSADGIAVVDVASRKVVRILKGVSDPEQLAVSKDGKRLFVASEDSARLFVVDTEQGNVLQRIDVGAEPEGVAVSPDGKTVLVTSEAENTVAIVDARTGKVRDRVGVGLRPRSCVFAPEGDRAYCVGEADKSLSFVDLRKRKVHKIVTIDRVEARPMGTAIGSDGQHVYVSTGRGGEIVDIETRAARIGGVVAVGGRPWGVALSPDGRKLYSADGPSNDVAVIDVATMLVTDRIKVGDKPWGVAAVSVR